MLRTSSQETEAPLSQETYDLLVRGLHDDQDNHDGPELMFEDDKARVTPIQELQFPSSYAFPPCADSLRPQIACMATSMQVYSSLPGKPSDADYPGELHFSVGFDPTQKPIQKSIPHTYSEELKQLFCNFDTNVPIKFFYNMENLPADSYIRGIIIGKKDDFVVKTCAKHAEEAKEKGKAKSAYHMLQFKTPNTLYGHCNLTGIYFVQIPLQPRQAGIDYQLEMVSFMCYNSDLKSKVDLQIIFTLEHSGTVLGRQAIGLRVCACPGRDRNSYEKRKVRLTRSLSQRSHSSDDNKAKRRKTETAKVKSEDKFYTLFVRDKKRFDQLHLYSKAMDAYEGEDTMGNLPVGQAKPAERTSSGGVSNWILNNSVMSTTEKTYPDVKLNDKENNESESS